MKKKHCIITKLTEIIGEPKELKFVIEALCLSKNLKITFDSETNDIFTNLSTNLVKHLLIPRNLFRIDRVHQYYSHLKLHDKSFSSHQTTTNVILNLLGKINTSKATVIDTIDGKLLMDGASDFADPIKLIKFPRKCKMGK